MSRRNAPAVSVSRPIRAVQCTASVRSGPRQGQQCSKLALLGHNVCLSHGGHLPSVRRVAAEMVEEARVRMVGMVDDAMDTLHDVMQPGVSDAVRLKAATEVLDRVGIRGGSELNVSVESGEDPAAALRDRLNKLRATAAVIDGEVASPSGTVDPSGDTIPGETQAAREELTDGRGSEERADNAVRP